LDRDDQRARFKSPCLKSGKGKSGADRGDGEVSQIRKIEAEDDPKCGFIECKAIFPDGKPYDKEDRQGIVTDIGELEKGGQPGMDELFQPDRWMGPEQQEVQPDEEIVEIIVPNTGNEASQAVEKSKNDGEREKIPKMGNCS